MTETQTSPAPGWYPDPGGSGGQRWWDGRAWTQTVQLPAAPIPAPAPAPAPTPAPTMAPAAAAAIEYAIAAPSPTVQAGPAASSPFGGPMTVAAPTHHAAAPSSTGMSTPMKAGLALLAALVVAGCTLWALNVGGSTPETAPTGGPRGPAAQAAAKLDALSLGAAEETVYAGRQSYLAVPKTSGVIEMGQTVVHLSPQDSASVTLNPSATGYCIVVTSTAPTTQASSTAVYVSTLGGLQPLATTCPASY